MTESNKNNNGKEDLTGKERFAWNVIASWAGYIFVLIPGFIMPRLISDYQGSSALGVWDFTWAFVNYLRISGFGIGSSVNRYVAKHRIEGDFEALRNTISTVTVIQVVIAIFVLLATVFFSYWLPIEFADSLGEHQDEVPGLVLFLGGSLALYFAFDSFRGVITGYHRWDVHNGIVAFMHGTNFVLMAIVLIAGGSLFDIAMTYFFVTVAGEISRAYWAFRLCPELRIRFSYLSWKRAKKMISFGMKTSLAGLPVILVLQSTSVLVMSSLGAAALAIYARPIALIRHLGTFVSKYSFVLIPMAGSIQANKNKSELIDFFLDSTKYGLSFTLPPVLFLVVYGDRILYYWMGEGYADWQLIAVLSLGYLLPISQNSVMTILSGLNAHGKAAMLSLGTAGLFYIGGAIYIESIGWSLLAAALLVSITLTLSQGVVVPLYACHYLKIPVTHYLYRVFTAPMMCGLVYFLIMIFVRWMWPDRPDLAMLIGGGLGAIVMLPIYWVWIAPDSFKHKIIKKLQKKTAKAAG
ncbi:MAG TPA: transporter [Gammaproteobacteria bacterium]|nr:transporter [Gammaproteobacteria bacterium]